MSLKNVYDCINKESGGVFEFHSHSKELRNAELVNCQKSNSQSATKEDSKDKLLTLMGLQKQIPTFIWFILCLSKSYYVLLSDDSHFQDMQQFCCQQNGVLSLDTTFNLSDNCVTDFCYLNLRIGNVDGKHCVVLGPSVIHSEKDYFLYSKFITRMCSFRSNIRVFHSIETNLDIAIYNGISSQLPRVMLHLCS